MRRLQAIAAIGLLLCAFSASAHKIPPGVYEQVPYNNNPFLFCTLGMPGDGWIALNWRVGSWQAITQYPNPRWIPTYMYICPAAARPAGGGRPYRPSDGSQDQAGTS